MKNVWRSSICVLLCVLFLSVGTWQADAQEVLDINFATVEQLMEVKGVGEVLAQRIIDYRQQHDGFKSLDDLSLVKGIGEKKLQQIRPFLMLVKNN